MKNKKIIIMIFCSLAFVVSLVSLWYLKKRDEMVENIGTNDNKEIR